MREGEGFMGPNIEENLKDRIKRWTLFLGVLQITVGCLVGLLPPSAVTWFRAIVMAHIEFVMNGILLVVFAFVVSELRLGGTALKTWFVSLQLGTWTNGAAGLAAAFGGASSTLMPTMNEKFPPPHGVESTTVTGLLIACAVTLLIALSLTLYGLVSGKAAGD
jgi:hypothetical protein